MLTMKTHREGEAEVYLYYHGIQVGTQFEGCRWGVAMRWSRRREGKGWDGMGTEEEGRTGREEGRNKGAVYRAGQSRAGQVYNKLITTVPTLPYLTYHRERKSERRKSRRGSLSATTWNPPFGHARTRQDPLPLPSTAALHSLYETHSLLLTTNFSPCSRLSPPARQHM